MKIGIISDCHLEAEGSIEAVVDMLPSKPVDVFVVAGDATRAKWCTDLCLLIQKRLDCDVLFIPGNHEYYSTYFDRCLMSDLETMWRDQFLAHPRLHYLQNSSVTIGDVSFFGSTWWSNFMGEGDFTDDFIDYYSDFKFILTKEFSKQEMKKKADEIRKRLPDSDLAHYLVTQKMNTRKTMTKDDMIALNRVAVMEYKTWYKTTPGRKVLVSHFPMLDSLRHTGFSPNPYFVSDNRELIEAYPPDLLIYGHTHWNIDVEDAGTRCVSNMYGYTLEVGRVGFDREKVVQL